MNLIGQSVNRVEDPAILRGATTYIDDIEIPGLLFAAIARSPIASGTFSALQLKEAKNTPGVVAVISAKDLGNTNGPLLQPTWHPPNASLERQIKVSARPEMVYLLADGRVRYVGEPVAVVVAENPAVAEDAVQLISADYVQDPPITNVADSKDLKCGLVNPNWPDNQAAWFLVDHGDVDAAFANASTIVSGVFRFGRQTGTPIEPRGIVADPTVQPFVVWSSNQAPHWLRDALVEYLPISAENLRVIAPEVGGGFGIKSMVYPEELLIPRIATILSKPLKWIETRTEHFTSSVHARDQSHEIELALSDDGKILGLRDHFVVDAGAANLEALVVPYNTASHLQGCYRIPTVRIECECVLTNKTPLSAYRGAGRPEAVFAMERILDQAAIRLQIDPAELRKINLLRKEEMPYERKIPYRDGKSIVLDGGDYLGAFNLALEKGDYKYWRKYQEQTAAQSLIGIGFATFIEGTGIGPPENAQVQINSDGTITVSVALPSQGQGHSTTLAQIAAATLGIPLDLIEVHQGDTHRVQDGGGTIASRTAVVVGNSVALAAESLKLQLFEVASTLLEVDSRDLELTQDRFSVRGAKTLSVSMKECAAAYSALDKQKHLVGNASFGPDSVTFAYGTHMVVVEVHKITGHVKILKYVVVHDCGRVINPMIVEGQIVGGIAQGIGGGLSEELIYDEAGQLVTGSFMDYQIPRITDIPIIDIYHLTTLSERNPLGIRGVGEAGTVAPPAALAGAIEDALRDYRVVIDRCPMSPAYISALLLGSVTSGAT